MARPSPAEAVDLVRKISNEVYGVLGALVIQKVYPDFANARDKFGKPILIRPRYVDNPNYSPQYLCWQQAMKTAAVAWNSLTREEQQPFYNVYKSEGFAGPFAFYFWLLRRIWAEEAGCPI